MKYYKFNKKFYAYDENEKIALVCENKTWVLSQENIFTMYLHNKDVEEVSASEVKKVTKENPQTTINYILLQSVIDSQERAR